MDNLTREHSRLRQRSEQAEEHLASLDLELQELTTADEALQSRAGRRPADADRSCARSATGWARCATRPAGRAADLRATRSGLASRIEVLEGLERSREGFGVGAREVFELGGASGAGARGGTVVGIVADFLTVRREYAPLIDLALGDRAQRFLVRDPGLLAAGACASGRSRFPAASAFCRLRPSPAPCRGRDAADAEAIRLTRAESRTAYRRACWRRRNRWCGATTRSWPTCRVGCWGGR